MDNLFCKIIPGCAARNSYRSMDWWNVCQFIDRQTNSHQSSVAFCSRKVYPGLDEKV
jgi:hypothetical protein